MKKNLLFGLLTAAIPLFGTSCSNENLEAAQSENEAQVSFNLGLEKDMGTRAISDGTSADKLVYAVFDKNGNRISSINKVEKGSVTFPATESITLPKGQTFKIAFWAQDADCTAYTVSDEMNVTVSYDGATNNDETRDAFFQTIEFAVTGSTTLDVELKRPFAQINVGVTQDDWTAAENSGMTIEKSSVKIKNAATSLNLLTGEVSGSVEVNYGLGAIPAETETLSVDADGDGTKETYKWLSMSYILTGAAQTTLDELSFVFDHNSTIYDDVELKEGLNNVPVQRNWRTNILGNLLTGSVSFNIAIEPAYDGDAFTASIGNANYNTLGDAIAAVKSNETIELEDEIKLQGTSDYVLLIDKPVTIDLNGHDIAADKTIFKVVAGGELTIKGKGNIQVENSDEETVIIRNESGTINFVDGTLKGPGVIYNKKVNETAAAGIINFRGSKFNNVEISDDFATKVTNDEELATAINNPDVSTIILSAKTEDEPYKIETYSSKESLTIIGTQNTKLTFKKNVTPGSYNQLTIHNCEILKHYAASGSIWGMIVYSSSNKQNGIYTVSNCTFNGEKTQGIYINENASGTVYNIVACTFNGDFGEGAVTIQNNENAVYTINVIECTFNSIPETSHKITFLFQHTDLILNTDVAESDIYWK